MRNCALGDCLVRLHEQVGHEVVATNYFGDEGAHVAKVRCTHAYLQIVSLLSSIDAALLPISPPWP